ncbi:hypothetical protein XSR1_20167 [Xenorhabdus szentirmaii DSM 16338]|uniref:Uncharacterized protein n=1 Tax=Xenorhabdus szentirmaii DSM 16338 TaxID=1427518 RepID=W1IV71_9GAMM|nr:hypothetical protein XSR1_20167 [Xenorhabdus szentirmaii DSM 16338]
MKVYNKYIRNFNKTSNLSPRHFKLLVNNNTNIFPSIIRILFKNEVV